MVYRLNYRILGFLLSLNGCSPALYDASLYGKLTDAANLIAPRICDKSSVIVTTTIDKFNTQWDWITLYAENRTGNTLTSAMLNNVNHELDGLNTIIYPGGIWSTTYCIEKLQGLRHAIVQVLRAEDRKATK
jgi:hypothetical protein